MRRSAPRWPSQRTTCAATAPSANSRLSGFGAGMACSNRNAILWHPEPSSFLNRSTSSGLTAGCAVTPWWQPGTQCYNGRPRTRRIEPGPMDSLTDEAPSARAGGTSGHDAGLLGLTLGSVGVVYGDIGTSPLYALREAVIAGHDGGAAAVTRESVLGVL